MKARPTPKKKAATTKTGGRSRVRESTKQGPLAPHQVKPARFQQIVDNPTTMTLLALQRAIGNRAASRLIAGKGLTEPKSESAPAGEETLSPGPAADDAPVDFEYPGRLLRQGSAGEPIRMAQTLLNRHANDLEVDGLFGPLTHAATIQFQQARGLAVDGIIGPNTWSALTAEGGATGKKPPDQADYATDLQQMYERLLDKNTSAQEVNEIMASLFGDLAGEPAGGETVFVSHLSQPWTGQNVNGLQALLNQVETILKQYYAAGFQIGGQTYPVLGIKELNLLLRVAQEGALHPGLKKNFPAAYLPLVPVILADDALRRQLISWLIFLTMAEGYRRLIVEMIALKKQQPQPRQAANHARRMAFVHRAMSFIGAIESKAAGGETAPATIDKQGYTTNPDNQKKKKTKQEYPLRQGADLFDRIWMEAVDESFYAGNDRWGPGKQYGDHIRLLRPPALPSWCGIYVNWIAIQEGLARTKWQVGGGNVDYKKWPNVYAAAHIPKKGLKPGDVLYAMNNNQHECIAISYDPATGLITSIDGNTAPGGGTTGGQILVQERHYTFFSHVRPFKA